ncbi:MAG: alpha/beta hydrolase [Rhodocyclaceae bacterium]|nr:alpha/beta hydrolase [Rhodocyclaceae bacterium]
MRERFVLCHSPAGFHRMAYTEWGAPDNPRVLVCAHGLTRTGRDFDTLAQALSGSYRVVCPDVVGRGASDWLTDARYYGTPQYVQDMVALLARLDVEQIDWLGTSMGGIIGMALAAQAGSPIRRLILNDVGAVISAAALERIGAYLAAAPERFASFDAAEAWVRETYAAFGPHSDEQWRELARHSVKPDGAGGFKLHYDRAIAQAFAAAQEALGKGQDMTLWPLYDAIRCPTLVVRGQRSDLLTRETVAAMEERGPRAKSVEIPGVGHAPTFMDEAQIRLVREFLC